MNFDHSLTPIDKKNNGENNRSIVLLILNASNQQKLTAIKSGEIYKFTSTCAASILPPSFVCNETKYFTTFYDVNYNLEYISLVFVYDNILTTKHLLDKMHPRYIRTILSFDGGNQENG